MIQLPRKTACVLLAVLILLLLVGTQMPGAWRDEAFRVTQLPWQLTEVAHFVLFVCLASVARVPPMGQSVARVLAGAIVLALLTEGLQHFASHRNPSLFDVGIDIGGAGLGLLLAGLVLRLKLLRF